MKTLQESLFDKDIITNDKRVGHFLKDLVFYDGEFLMRLKGNFNFDITAGLPGQTHALSVIDWKKVRKDLIKYNGNNIDLGLYAHYNSDKYKVHSIESTSKTEAFAKLILCIPTAEECNFNSYNSRFRDEMCKKLNEYIISKMKDIYSFDIETKDGDQLDIVLNKNYNEQYKRFEVCRWEFLKITD